MTWQNEGPTSGGLASGRLQMPIPTEWPPQGARASLNSASENTSHKSYSDEKDFQYILYINFIIIVIPLCALTIF